MSAPTDATTAKLQLVQLLAQLQLSVIHVQETLEDEPLLAGPGINADLVQVRELLGGVMKRVAG